MDGISRKSWKLLEVMEMAGMTQMRSKCLEMTGKYISVLNYVSNVIHDKIIRMAWIFIRTGHVSTLVIDCQNIGPQGRCFL